MQVLILAAGRGIRLHPFTYRKPKCLLKINSLTTIELMLNNLSSIGISEVLIVAGNKKEMIIKKLGNKYRDVKIKYIINEFDKSTNNIYSLWKAREAITSDLLIIHGDVICEPTIIKKIVFSKIENSFAVEFRKKLNDEDYKVKVMGDRITDMGKEIPIEPGARYGEAIGINRFNLRGKELLFKAINDSVELGQTNIFWEDAFKNSLGMIDLRALDITGLKCIEIDFRSDLKKAKKIFKQKNKLDPK